MVVLCKRILGILHGRLWRQRRNSCRHACNTGRALERLYDDTRRFVKLHGRLAQVSIRKRGLPDFVADLKPEGMSLFGTPMLHMSGCMDNKVVLLIDAVARDDGNPTVSMIPGELQAPEILWTSPRH